MSAKPFISAEEHLKKLEFTTEQASEFIFSNVNEPEIIFATAAQYGVTNAMLSEITNFSVDVVSEYFENAGKKSVELDYTSLLANSDLGSLETLVDFNNNTGILSSTSLNEAVQSKLDNPNRLDFFFEPIFSFQQEDDLYDQEELGVGHLVDVPATNESLESLFYGSLINMMKKLDDSELNQIKIFQDTGNTDGFQVLLLDALSEAPESDNRTDEQLAELVATEAVNIIDPFFDNSNALVGILDLSYLGLATA